MWCLESKLNFYLLYPHEYEIRVHHSSRYLCVCVGACARVHSSSEEKKEKKRSRFEWMNEMKNGSLFILMAVSVVDVALRVDKGRRGKDTPESCSLRYFLFFLSRQVT